MNATETPRPPSVAVLSDPERATALLDPDRRRLLEALGDRPDSASGLARRLDDSRQRLNYHLRALEDAGLVELQEERRRGNCTERVLRTVARRFVVDPAALGALAADPADAGDRFSATYLVAVAARAIRELAALGEKADTQERRLATVTIESEVRVASPRDFEAFVDDLSEAVARVVAEHHDEGSDGRRFRVIVGSYPGPEQEAGGTESTRSPGCPRAGSPAGEPPGEESDTREQERRR